MPPTPRDTGPRLLRSLHRIRASYSPVDSAEKLRILSALAHERLLSAASVRALHDDALFLVAFPDDARVLALALEELARTPVRVQALPASARRRLDDTGLAGSRAVAVFSWPVVRWLASRPACDAELDWESIERHGPVDAMLRQIHLRVDEDLFDSGEISTREWVTLAAGAARGLGWLAAQAPAEGTAHRVWCAAWDSAEVGIRWRAAGPNGAIGTAIFDEPPVRFRRGMRQLPADPRRLIARPLAGIRRLRRPEAERLLEVAVGTLAARSREVFAMTRGNPDEVYLADLEQGVQVAVFGVRPEWRLGFEANYGHLLLSNGVPVGYGGVTPLGSQANTGLNVFDPFRGAESAMMFAQALRAFRTLFGVTRFVVNPYQFGAGNDEALQSGAYWLYDRLGFRPITPAVRLLAERERVRRGAERAYRSPITTLRTLAEGDLVLELPGSRTTPFVPEDRLLTVSRRATERFGREPLRPRDALARADAHRLAAVLGTRVPRGPVGDGFVRLAPLVLAVDPDVALWPAAERRALTHLLRANGAPQEREFVAAFQRLPRLLRALAALPPHS